MSTEIVFSLKWFLVKGKCCNSFQKIGLDFTFHTHTQKTEINSFLLQKSELNSRIYLWNSMNIFQNVEYLQKLIPLYLERLFFQRLNESFYSFCKALYILVGSSRLPQRTPNFRSQMLSAVNPCTVLLKETFCASALRS